MVSAGTASAKELVLRLLLGVLGVTGSELKELLPGSSITAVAEETAVPVEDDVAAIVAAWQRQVDLGVADGYVSEGRAATLRDRSTGDHTEQRLSRRWVAVTRS